MGLAAYAEDLCAAVARLAAHFKQTVNISPVPFILCADTTDASLIRSIVELYAWINAAMADLGGLSAAAFHVSLEGLNYNGSGLVQHVHPMRYRLPSAMNGGGGSSSGGGSGGGSRGGGGGGNSGVSGDGGNGGGSGGSRKIWLSSGLAPLPSTVKQFDRTIECEIIGRLIRDLNVFLALNLQPRPYYDRLVAREDMLPPDGTSFILVGASHALRTANGLARRGKKAIAATIAGWKPVGDQIKPMLGKIERALSLCPDKEKAIFVLQAMDNCSYFCQDEEGNIASATKGLDSKHHIPGNSVLAHPDTQYMLFKKMLPIFDAIKEYKKIILSPLPRYWESRCCGKKSHVRNLDEADYRAKLEAGVYDYKNNLRAHCFRHGVRSVRVLGPWHLIKKETGIWADPVHLVDGGYDILADAVIKTVEDMEAKRKVEAGPGNPPKKPKRDVSSGPATGANSFALADRKAWGRHERRYDDTRRGGFGSGSGWRRGGPRRDDGRP